MKKRIRRTIIKYYDIPEDASPQTRWLLNIMNEYELDCAKLARKIHVTRQTVCNWVRDDVPMSFGNICAIVLLIDKYANPEKIYQTISERRTK